MGGTATTRSGPSVSVAGMGDRDGPVAEVDDGIGNRMLRASQRRNRAIDLRRIRPVAERVLTQVIGRRRQIVDNLRCAVDLGVAKPAGTQDVIKVLVCQHDMCHSTISDLAHVRLDGRRLDEGGAAVYQQRPARPHTSPTVTSQNASRQR